MRAPFATGLGYDVHQFADGRRLVLGGVEIPSPQGLLGHSDADVLLHALMDALLGAAGLPDIGHYFPNTEERWRGADSHDLLCSVRQEIRSAGWLIGNADMTLIAEHPKIAPHIPAMKKRIGAALEIPQECLAIKATTNETMGFIGRGEGIAAMAAVLLYR